MATKQLLFEFSERVGTFAIWYKGMKIARIIKHLGRWRYIGPTHYRTREPINTLIAEKISALNWQG